MQIRPEILDPIVAAGAALFEGPNPYFKNGVPRYNVLAWLFTHCADHGIVLGTLERDRAVGRIHAAANKVKDYSETHVLTVAELREKIAALPENMPVMYQRIEDVLFEKRGWRPVALTWETHEPHEGELEFIRDEKPALTDIVERDGKTLVRELSDYIPALGAYVTSDDEGNQVLCVHAHY